MSHVSFEIGSLPGYLLASVLMHLTATLDGSALRHADAVKRSCAIVRKHEALYPNDTELSSEMTWLQIAAYHTPPADLAHLPEADPAHISNYAAQVHAIVMYRTC